MKPESVRRSPSRLSPLIGRSRSPNGCLASAIAIRMWTAGWKAIQGTRPSGVGSSTCPAFMRVGSWEQCLQPIPSFVNRPALYTTSRRSAMNPCGHHCGSCRTLARKKSSGSGKSPIAASAVLLNGSRRCRRCGMELQFCGRIPSRKR